MARPKIAAERLRDQQLGLRFAAAEIAAIEAAAAKSTLHRSEFARKAVLKAAGLTVPAQQQPPPMTGVKTMPFKEQVLLRAELRRIGINLNNLVRMRASHQPVLQDDFVVVVKELRDRIAQALV